MTMVDHQVQIGTETNADGTDIPEIQHLVKV